MKAYYNEIEPFAVQWLKNLITAGHIAPGDVDERSITEVRAPDLVGYDQCHFFAGIGGWNYALRLAGWPDDRPVWTGSCPCQPWSAAGKGGGEADERHLWPEFFRLIRECRPDTVFGEQVAAAVRMRWLDTVSSDLETKGYAVGACVLGAHSVGAPHIRQRLWYVAESGTRGVADADGGITGDGYLQPSRQHGQQPQNRVAAEPEGEARNETWVRGPESRCADGGLGDPDATGSQGRELHPERAGERLAGASGLDGFWSGAEFIPCLDGKARPVKPGIFPLVASVPRGVVRSGDSSVAIHANASGEARAGRLRGYGNAINAEVAAAFIGAYMDCAA